MISYVCYCFQSDSIVIGVLVLSEQISKHTRYDCIFFILAVLITFEQSKSYTATNLCYIFRRIFCGRPTHLRFFSVLSINRSKYLNSVFLKVFFKTKSVAHIKCTCGSM